jgi:hypothetical protein
MATIPLGVPSLPLGVLTLMATMTPPSHIMGGFARPMGVLPSLWGVWIAFQIKRSILWC